MNKYRAFTESGEEVVGYYVCVNKKHYILPTKKGEISSFINKYNTVAAIIGDFFLVLPHTIAQFTGRLDKDDKKIYGSIEIDGVETKGSDRVRITWDDGEIEEYTIMWSDCNSGFILDSFAAMPESWQIEVLGPQYMEK